MRRTADTTKGIAATVASAVPMAGEMTTQGVKDIRATQKNEAALDKELEGDARGKELKDRITAVDMDYNPQYTDEDLRGIGYGGAGLIHTLAIDKNNSGHDCGLGFLPGVQQPTLCKQDIQAGLIAHGVPPQ